MQYAVCEINGRQYLIKPGQIFEVDRLEVEKSLKVDKVLLRVDGEKVEIGTPFLKEGLELEVIGNVKKEKIRVAKFHAKANYRKVIGSRREMTQLRLAGDKKEVKEQPKKTKSKKEGTEEKI